jgi:hypothetical protein
MANFKDGVVRDGSSAGTGKAFGNIKDGVVRDGSSKGTGKAIFNIKGGAVRDGSSVGTGKTIGKFSAYTIKGMERELDAEIVATYHFLIKKIV